MQLDRDFAMTIGGALEASSGSIPVINPADGKVFASAPDASREQLDRAVIAAQTAYVTWRSTPLAARRKFMNAAADIIEPEIESLARLLTREQGKPVEAAVGELKQAVQWFRHYAEVDIPVDVYEEGRRRIETRHVPMGVVGAIAPWNFPVNLAIWKVSPAVAAGNTVVLKPSPFTPLTTLKLGELLRGVFPPGVLNVISGGDALGPWMTAHPGFAKIAFTGSTATGKKVMESAAPTLKRLTLELGGNDAAIVMPDIDIAAVAPRLFMGAFYNTGQICVATKRLYIHEEIYDPLRDRLVEIAKNTRVGDGAEQGTQLGPIQNKLQFERVRNLLADARAKNLTLLQPGQVPNAGGYFIPVTIVDNPPEDSRVVTEEAFGPVLPILKFRDVDDVINRANATSYGLAGAVWSKDVEQASEIAARLETGNVWINENLYLSPGAPFGGHKQSGIGVENGLPGLLAYTNSKSIYVPKPRAERRAQ
jgi:acyl-CoA reductase-like NAD-dependent aldehyde dehydrogenase